MQQLILEMRPDAPPSFDNFVTGSNGELVQALLQAIGGRDGHLYLWGEAGSGRTHLLRAAVAQALTRERPASYIAAEATETAELPQDEDALLAIDNVERLTATTQIALFNSFNRSRRSRQTLILAGGVPPLALALREDLRTRIGQCLIYQAHSLDDDTRMHILLALAQRRGLELHADVAAFLLRHGRRDLPHLSAVLDALDRASLERKRAITLPLLRELLQRGLQL